MKRKILTANFFERDTVLVAQELLGKYLVRRYRGRTGAYKILETEAYDGANDRASHAHRGLTPRTAPMFGRGGNWYVYFTYGMHWMLNIVTREKGHPSAVLIRAAGTYGGPAILTKALHVDKKLNSFPAAVKSGLWIEDRGEDVDAKNIKTGPRVGVNYAGKYWAARRWRFRL